MAFGVKLKVWGDYASFNRPEGKVERISYDVMTPSAARGILEAIHWKPGMRWIVDEIRVYKPIRFTHVRRNELEGKIPTKNASAAMKGSKTEFGAIIEEIRQQRAAMILADICYGISAHIEILRPDSAPDGTPIEHPEVKHLEAFKRRASKGQFFHQPYFGTREFPVFFELVETLPEPDIKELKGELKLGLMLHDMVFSEDPEGKIVESNQGRRLSAEARFFDAVLINGVMRIPPLQRGEGTR